MNYHVLTANIFELVSRNFTDLACIYPISNFGDRSNGYKHNSYVINYKNNVINVTNCHIPKYCEKIFASFSLIDLRNVLLLLIPFATNFNGGERTSINTLEHVKLTLKYITDEIKLQCDGDINSGSITLINENRELTNKYNALKQKYDSMRAIFEDPK